MNGSYDRPNIPYGRNVMGTPNMTAGGRAGSSPANNSSAAAAPPESSANNSNNDNMNWLEEQIKQHPDFRTPPQQTFDTEEMEGSIQKILAENIGNYVVVEFLIGTERMSRKQGYLYHIGTSYITLYDDENENFILCDIFSVKFVYFYMPGQRPNRNFNILPHTNGNIG